MCKMWVILFVWSTVGLTLARYSVRDCSSNFTSIVQTGQNFTYRFDVPHPRRMTELAFFICDAGMCDSFKYVCYHAYTSLDCRNNERFQVDANLTITMFEVQPSYSTVYFKGEGPFWYLPECLFLHIIDVQIYSKTIPGYVEEGGGFVLKVTSPNLNYTSTRKWDISGQSLDGLGYTVTTTNSLEIKETSRGVNSMVISYIVEEHNNTASFDYQVKIAYGPDRYLRFSPNGTLYNVDIGDDLGIIECSADCNPSCDISWTKLSSNTSSNGSLLRLGTVTTAMDGEYICTATRAGTSQISRMSLYVVVKDFGIQQKSISGKKSLLMTVALVSSDCCLAVVAVFVMFKDIGIQQKSISGEESLLMTVALVSSGCSMAVVAVFVMFKGIQMLKKMIKKQDVSGDQEQTTETREEPTMTYSALQRSAQASQDQYSSLEREEAFYEEC